MIAMHHSVAGKFGLPYAPVYGVATDGTAYTALSHVHAQRRRAKVEMSFMTLSGFTYGSGSVKNRNLFGCTTNDGYSILTNYNDGNSWEFQIYSSGGMVPKRNVPSSAGVVHAVTAVREGTLISLTFDGSTSSNSNGTADMTLGRMGIFTQNNYGPGDGVSPMPNRVPKMVAILSFKYWDGDELCAELVPCMLKSTQEYGFWDLVNGEFLGNMAGSGAFYGVSEGGGACV